MGFIEWIQGMMSNGTLPTIGTLALGALAVGLEIAKNKLLKKLNRSEADNAALAKKIEALEEANKRNGEVAENTNAMVSAVADMLHVAYAGSKLGVDTKLQLQKVYDSCPDSLAQTVDLVKLIGQLPTPAQEAEVNATVPKSYADTIAEKYKE